MLLPVIDSDLKTNVIRDDSTLLLQSPDNTITSSSLDNVNIKRELQKETNKHIYSSIEEENINAYLE
ncbi:MAG: hypothetical protein L3J47_02200, partial [Sulfurovum sp.]|nr:hypothetical protein [Sulfurovum sp.]